MARKPMKERYEEYMARREIAMQSPMGAFQDYKRYMPPFHIWGNLYYVGDKWCSIYIVDTGDGLLMLDAGMPAGSIPLLLQTIWEAGFNPRNIKWLILDHGHIDHIGAANFMRNMFGTKLIISAEEAKMFRERPWLSCIQDSSDIADCVFVPDIEVQDGQTVTFGNTPVTFIMTPGHTPGAMAMLFTVTDGKDTKTAGFFGAHGLNTITTEQLLEIGDTEFKTRQIFLDSIKKIRDLDVEIFASGHTGMNQILGKLEQWKQNPEYNPFVNRENWIKFCDAKIEELELFIQDPTRKFRYGQG